MTLPVESLRLHDGYWYLATTYTQHPLGFHAAHADACLLAARLLSRGVNVLSPIAHSHPIQVAGALPDEHDFWMWVDRPLVRAAYGVLVADMGDWDRSRGIAQEIAWAETWGKPVRFLDPRDLSVEVMA